MRMMMAPQLHVTTYSEQFGPAGKGRPAQLRPTSSHRRNNPHPRPDFLLPRRIQSSYRPSRSALRSHEEDAGPLFPPVRQLTFHNPDIKPNHQNYEAPLQPVTKPSTAPALPSADQPRELQLAKPLAASDGQLKALYRSSGSHRSLQQQPDYLRNTRSAQGYRTIATNTETRPPTGNPLSSQHRYRRSRSNSNSTVDSCGYSCFQVVKSYQAGHYIIHPQFVSENLRFTTA